MCDPSLLMAGGLVETLGDPLGTRKRRDEQQTNKWAREDAIRDATWAHEKEMAGMTNRSQLGTGTVGRAPGSGSGTGTGTPKASRGGGRSSGNQAY